MKKLVLTTAIAASVFVAGPGAITVAEELVKHKVVKGDTLWDLGEGYLNDNFQWRKIWEVNPEIKDPHWIYPDQVVRIPKSVLAPPPEEKMAEEAPAEKEVVKEAADDDLDALAALARRRSFTARPLDLTVTRGEIEEVAEEDEIEDNLILARLYDQGIGMVVPKVPANGQVLSTERGWRHLAAGETVQVRAPGAEAGQRFGVYRNLGRVYSPTGRKKNLGYLLADVAIVEIVADEGTGQRAAVRRAFTELKAGDLLGPVPEQPVVAASPTRHTPAFTATVVALKDQKQLAGPGDIVYLDAGGDRGLTPGVRLEVRTANGTTRPAGALAGEIMVLKVTADRAAALVTGKSQYTLRAGDLVGAVKR